MAVPDTVEQYLAELEGESRRLARGEWGITLDAERGGGRPLHLGLRLADGLLSVRAHAVDDPAGADPWMLLWWNRSTRLVRFGATREGEIWVHGDLPAAAVDAEGLDRLLGLAVEGALAVRSHVAPAERAAGPSWLGGA